MNVLGFDAVEFQGKVYCIGCLPDPISLNDEDVLPIFANSVVKEFPNCEACGVQHDYMWTTTVIERIKSINSGMVSEEMANI